MSRYKAYSEYKDSGVEWLGQVPSHWSVSKVKYLTSFQVGWTPPTKDDGNFEGENLWANISDLKEREIFDTNKKISDSAAKIASMEISPKGSLLYSFKLSVGTVSFAGKDMYTNEAIASFLEESKLPLSYLYYVLPKYLIENASTNIYGARILNQELICNADLIAPTFDEAQNVANFLDHETAKIDALIEKQQRLIELLKEKRQAVISHAVTKGLNPNVPLKDSGVEWLGEVPAHWDITQLKHATSMIVDCPHETPVYSEDGQYLVIRTADLDEGHLDSSRMYRVEEDEYILRIRRADLRQGDIVYGREGERWGHAGLVPEDGRYCLGQRMMQFRTNPDFCPDFLMWLLNSDNVYKQGQLDTVGATSPHVNVGTIRNYSFVQPPLVEQQEIGRFLNEKTHRFDVLTDKASNTVLLFQERRTALISAAVTGKIDVRDWQAAA